MYKINEIVITHSNFSIVRRLGSKLGLTFELSGNNIIFAKTNKSVPASNINTKLLTTNEYVPLFLLGYDNVRQHYECIEFDGNTYSDTSIAILTERMETFYRGATTKYPFIIYYDTVTQAKEKDTDLIMSRALFISVETKILDIILIDNNDTKVIKFNTNKIQDMPNYAKILEAFKPIHYGYLNMNSGDTLPIPLIITESKDEDDGIPRLRVERIKDSESNYPPELDNASLVAVNYYDYLKKYITRRKIIDLKNWYSETEREDYTERIRRIIDPMKYVEGVRQLVFTTTNDTQEVKAPAAAAPAAAPEPAPPAPAPAPAAAEPTAEATSIKAQDPEPEQGGSKSYKTKRHRKNFKRNKKSTHRKTKRHRKKSKRIKKTYRRKY